MTGLGTSFGMKNPLIFSSFATRAIAGMDNAMKKSGDEIVEFGIKEIHSRLYPGHGYLTGELYESYEGKATAQGTDRVEVEMGSKNFKAPINEFSWGGKNSHFFPSMAEVEKKAPEIIKKNVDSIFKI